MRVSTEKRLLSLVKHLMHKIEGDLTFKQFKMLLVVANHKKGIDFRNLELETGLPHTNMRRYVKQVRSKGQLLSFMELIPDPSDNRRQLVVLSSRGQQFISSGIKILKGEYF